MIKKYTYFGNATFGEDYFGYYYVDDSLLNDFGSMFDKIITDDITDTFKGNFSD